MKSAFQERILSNLFLLFQNGFLPLQDNKENQILTLSLHILSIIYRYISCFIYYCK